MLSNVSAKQAEITEDFGCKIGALLITTITVNVVIIRIS
jgi:hypothetical protein